LAETNQWNHDLIEMGAIPFVSPNMTKLRQTHKTFLKKSAEQSCVTEVVSSTTNAFTRRLFE
jgi:hypothetical protein